MYLYNVHFYPETVAVLILESPTFPHFMGLISIFTLFWFQNLLSARKGIEQNKLYCNLSHSFTQAGLIPAKIFSRVSLGKRDGRKPFMEKHITQLFQLPVSLSLSLLFLFRFSRILGRSRKEEKRERGREGGEKSMHIWTYIAES